MNETNAEHLYKRAHQHLPGGVSASAPQEMPIKYEIPADKLAKYGFASWVKRTEAVRARLES